MFSPTIYAFYYTLLMHSGGFGGDNSTTGDGFGGNFGSGLGGSSTSGKQSFNLGGQGQAGSFYGKQGGSSGKVLLLLFMSQLFEF